MRLPPEIRHRAERVAASLWFMVHHGERDFDGPMDAKLARDLWLAEPPERRDRWVAVVMMIWSLP